MLRIIKIWYFSLYILVLLFRYLSDTIETLYEVVFRDSNPLAYFLVWGNMKPSPLLTRLTSRVTKTIIVCKINHIR